MRLQVQIILSKLNDFNAYQISRLILGEFIDPPKYFTIIKLLTTISIASFIVTILIPKYFLLLVALFCINMVIHFINKKHIEMYLDSIPQLYKLCNCIRDLLKLDLPIESTNKMISSLKSIELLKSRMKVFTLEAKSVDFPVGFFIIFWEYIKIQFLLKPIIVFNVLKRLKEKRREIQDLFEYVGKVDCAISIASLRYGVKHFCQPNISEQYDCFAFTDIYHPLVTDCISNLMTVKDKSILLTGSNMSGKSTFIRSVAISTLFAQTINTCFASSFTLSPMRIFSAIRISDDVLSGKSYYFEEVLTINELIKESQSGIKTLFLLDEIFKGTNTIERIAAGKAVLSYIGKNGNIVFVSTHDIELTDLLSSSYELFHFTEIVEGNLVHFDYKLKEGKLTTRNAIRILEINGYPRELIEEARRIALL
jgi:hypothetical protein